jgi:YggT family protein
LHTPASFYKDEFNLLIEWRSEMSNDSKMTEVKSVQVESGREQRIFTFKATQLVLLLAAILEVLIGLRIVLKLIAANPNNSFAALIYAVTDLFLFPFAGLTSTPTSGGMVLELSSFLAMLVYALIAWAVERTIWVIFYRPRGPVVGVTQTTTTDQHTHI